MTDGHVPGVDDIDSEGMSQYLAETDVVLAVLFGSQAQETADNTSDVDVALKFPDQLSATERFRRRNRIDAELQSYADRFVDVSDIDTLPLPVAYAALTDGMRLTGDAETHETLKTRITREYEETATERQRERQEFIDRLASGKI